MPQFHHRRVRDYTTAVYPLAVIICRTPNGTHVGVLHTTDDIGNAAIFHLGWHLRLFQEPLPSASSDWEDAVWAAPPVEPETANNLAAMCRRVWRRYQFRGLPYALEYVEGRFDIGTGELLLGERGSGLTCATFVLALFNSHGLRLLRQEEWRPRPEDLIWQQRILEFLAKTPSATAEHVARVSAELGCVRFRPTDVVAGAGADTIPLGFAAASALGEQIMALLEIRDG